MRQGAIRGVRNAPGLGLRSRLVLGTALATSAFVGGYRGYLRRAFADCAGAGGTYTCSGVTTQTQTLPVSPPPGVLTVTTDPGFSIDTTGTGGNAFTLTGNGGLAFTDYNLSTITGYLNGISADNSGSGALSITVTGTVTGTNLTAPYTDGIGIIARNFGTDLTINAVDVSGVGDGITARNYGSGALSINATGAVTSAGYTGIYALNEAGTGLTVKAVDVSGEVGITARNYGTDALSITTTGTVTGTDTTGIYARNSGTDLTINAADVTGAVVGITARQYGSGALSITTTGTVTGTAGVGIFATDEAGTDLNINAAAVTGADYGIYAVQHGTGALSITATGTVTGTNIAGIYAKNYGTDLTINAADVNGSAGIVARQSASGALSITATGTVTGNGGAGIVANNESEAASSATTVNVASGATVNGTTAGVALVSDSGRTASVVNAGSIQGATGIIASTAGPVTITNTGSITGTGGTAIDLTGTSGANTVNQQGGVISGNVSGGGGGDAISVSGGTITGNVTGGGGADRVTVSRGTIAGGIDAESVTLTGGTIGGDITGLGPDTLIINGSAVPLVLRNGIVFSGTNANAFITNEDLAQGGAFTQVFTGFASVTSDNSTLGFGTGAIGIGTLTLVNGSMLYINGNVNMPGGTANVTGSTIQMIDGATDDVFTLGGIALNGATLGFDVNQQTLQADQIVAGTFSALGTNTILVNILGAPQFSQPTQIQIIQTGSPITGNFVIVGVPGTQSALFNYQLIFGPGGGLFVVATPDNVGVALAAQNAVDVGATNVMIDALYGINNDAIMHDLGLANGAAVASLSDTLDVFASGQFAHTEHDGFDVNFGGINGVGPSFGLDEFSAAISLDFNAAKAFDFDKQYGLNLGIFGGYASADVDIGGFQTFTSSGEAKNRSGMFGAYGLFRQNLTYALVSAIAFLGQTDITNDILGTTGDYDTEGYGVTASAGHIFVLDDKLRFDLRGGILGVTFTGGDYTDSGGNQFGESRISFGALKLEPGIYADYPLENGMTLSPYARIELQQRFGYSNKASIDGGEVNFDDADFSAAAYGGFNLKMSERSTLSSEIRGKWSADSTTIAGKLGLKVAF